ncbi:TetR/AcrR family transcriptional regulator, tetracycline repressor protein [Saccharopolyspora antimicrobica]|uniref:TetR family transcriptional regulator n=1 Tax=Saccharopolyspora antimicrobica TaxID=455193 RepID=A0A1I5CJP6_9PSEU|nr:TetR/AcrR family transcriptional regulator C-terminal domain-containing protein [Saccharopolyspora antimicrobica]RKT88835.1 TetR family transcriptional regulator [Saccharopolyspora antimicrobica]SFN87114.1 TetR/AcrR family transcriptional regulator, tetracycline repressor protein [Saccharopolyspora antimicrobica]
MSERQREIARAALELLEDRGAEAVSLRAVADRLGVRLNTVSWHVGSKAGLQDLMADEIVGEVSLKRLPKEWEPRVRELVRRYRAALLRHRDGAAVVAGTFVAKQNTLGLSEALVAALLDSGCGDADAAWTAWTLVYFTLGLVAEEQSAPDSDGGLAAAVTAGAFPALARTVAHIGGANFVERHQFGLDLILDGLRARIR